MRSSTAFHNLPMVLLMVCAYIYTSSNLHADAVVVAVDGSASLSTEAEVSAEHTDSYNIRHGRSKVRHSNEKEQLLWAMRPQNANAGNDGVVGGDVSARGKGEDNEISGSSVNSGRKNTTNTLTVKKSHLLSADDYDGDLMPNSAEATTYNFTAHKSTTHTRVDGSWNHKEAVSSIQTGNSELFGSDYWRNSYVNGSLINPFVGSAKRRLKPAIHIEPLSRSHSVAAAYFGAPAKRKDITHTETPDVGPNGLVTTEAPVTHRIRKLHMKKIMESIRNSGGGVGEAASVLMTAEQLQGRPMDLELVKLDKKGVVDDVADTKGKLADSSDADSAAEMLVEEAEDEPDNISRPINNEVEGGEVVANEAAKDSGNTRDVSGANAASQSAENSAVDDSEDAESSDNELVADMGDTSDGDEGGVDDDIDTDVELDEVLQLADELDMPVNSLDDVGDDYTATTTPAATYTTIKPDGSAELSEHFAEMITYATLLGGSNLNSQGTEMQNDDTFAGTTSSIPTLSPTRKTTTKLKLIPKSARPTKLILLPTMAMKDFAQSKAAVEKMLVNQTQNRTSISVSPKWQGGGVYVAPQQGDVLERRLTEPPKSTSLPTDFIDSNELRDIIDVSQLEGVELANDTAEYDDSTLRNASKHSISQAPPSTLQTLIGKEASPEDYRWPATNFSLEPNQQASTSVGGIASVDRQQAYDVEDINFEQVVLENTDDITMDDGHMDNRNAHGFPVSNPADLVVDEDGNNETDNGGGSGGDGGADGVDDDQTSRFLAGVVDAANEDEIYDWDEISRNNRRNLMRGRDVVTKFLQIVETQHLLGANCEAGTSLNLGEGVVDRYAQDRFRVEAEVAVNRANMLTRSSSFSSAAVQVVQCTLSLKSEKTHFNRPMGFYARYFWLRYNTISFFGMRKLTGVKEATTPFSTLRLYISLLSNKALWYDPLPVAPLLSLGSFHAWISYLLFSSLTSKLAVVAPTTIPLIAISIQLEAFREVPSL
ncbi:unnamed protein product [Ceratitis capitata]|uniref:(Mediterranean fruit fly) hypothetical protein n=1 Tax=Ceratitis capitata TaxID=7213 RepID=A0A811VG41_CERCA|nr:unnamed protein product [Ceratitis capitata]